MRYVGVPHATFMYNNFYCLEEYLVYLSEHHRYGEEQLQVEGADGYIYEIYYVTGSEEGEDTSAVTEAGTEGDGASTEESVPFETLLVPVPENREYTISGDNKVGFIVTFRVDKVE